MGEGQLEENLPEHERRVHATPFTRRVDEDAERGQSMITLDKKPEVQVRQQCPVCKGKCYTMHDDDVEGLHPVKCITCRGDGHVYEWISIEKLSELIPIS